MAMRSAPALCPTLAKLEKEGFLSCRAISVNHKQRKYYRTTAEGGALLECLRHKIKELFGEVVEQP